MLVKICLFLLFLAFSASAQKPVPPGLHANPTGELDAYRSQLDLLRQTHPNRHELPDLKFFLFGMGDRLKLIYRNGRLLNALTGNIEEQWAVKQEIIVPPAYLVHLVLTNGQTVQIQEDAAGVWLLQTNKRPRLLPGTRSRLNLPDFVNKRFGSILRVLHQEILMNVRNGRPMPNFLIYQNPRYRDAALVAMVLRKTKNLPLIRDWIMAIRDPFDRHKQGLAEADNPGEVLFLVSLVSDKSHPVVQMALDSVKPFEKEDYIAGKTDYADHPVYQTKWFKYGLKSLGLPDPYHIPRQYDSYSSLFWWAYTSEHVAGKKFTGSSNANYPYFAWAEDHFYNENRGLIGTIDYPLSWEQQASDAHYPGLTVLDKDLIRKKIAFPHAWHAAEQFLLLADL
ncbi:hypothetical protein GCM10028819_29860 [Spirosoma humi]